MRVSDFSFELPDSLIAHYPQTERTHCRLLSLAGETGAIEHGLFTDLLTHLSAGDLLVFNDTRVIPARLFGQKSSGGKVEVLVERVLDEQRVLAHLKASKAPKEGSSLLLGDNADINATMVARHDALFELCFHDERDIFTLLEQEGHMPLPPYIARPDETIDRELYQTVYSRYPGAVAAPTAGLHFDETFLQALRDKGVEQTFVTLHVGAGTFQPVRVEQITDHHMHAEYVEVSEEAIAAILACKKRGNRVIAVGTTAVRSIESAAQAAKDTLIAPMVGDTRIFIYPGYEFQVVDALITNFHLPESTLIMLVSAFSGYQNTMNAYRQAVAERYRFFSYGDAMFITHNPAAVGERP